MKKTTPKKKFTKRLTQYSALTLAIAGVADAEGQIMYTDVNPDFEGGLDLEYMLDLNNDSTPDFRIFRDSDGDLYMSPLNINNEVLGNAYVSSLGYYALIYPFALDSGVVISNGASGAWYNENNFSIGYTSLNWNSCNAGYWCDVNDKFLGLRFDIGGNTHYGWARLDVSNVEAWVVKDYAYEASANTPITTDATLSLDYLEKNTRVTCVDRIVTISKPPGEAFYRVISITGQIVNEGITRLETQKISLETLSSGMYIVEVSDVNSNAVTRKKIAI